MNIFDLLESPGMGRPRDTKGVQSAADQSAASVIGSGTTKREANKKPVTMMGQNVKEAVEEAAVKPNFKMPPESLQDKMYRQHQELRKKRGAPSPEEYKERIAQKQKEIDDLKEGILDRAAPKMPKPRNPANAVLGNKVNASGRHLDKKRRQELAPKHKHQDPLEESLRPGERHHFETDPVTGKRVYKGIRGDQQDAPQRAKDDPAARADQERKAHIAHDRGLTEQGVEEEFRIGKKLGTKRDRFKSLRKRKDGILGEFDSGEEGFGPFIVYLGDHLVNKFATFDEAKEEIEFIKDSDPRTANELWKITDGTGETVWEHDPGEMHDQMRRAKKIQVAPNRKMTESKLVKITDYDTWSDKVKELGGEIHPQKDRNLLVAQSWDGEEIGKFHLGKNMGFINQSGDLDETIRKMGSQYRLLSKKGKNLGTFDSKAGAEKHEREVQYFKHKNMEEDTSAIKKKISKYEELALAANRAGDDAKCKMYQKKIQALKSQGVEEGWKGKVAGAALAGAAALGGGDVDAQQIDLPGPQVSYIAHIQAEFNGREISKTVNLGPQYESKEQAEQDLEDYMQSKGITRYSIRVEQSYDQPGGYGQRRRTSGYATGGYSATGPISAPGLGDMIAGKVSREIRAGIPDKGGYATGGSNKGQRPRDGSQWWRDQLPRIKEDVLEEDIESHLYLMSRAGYDIVQEEWSDKYKDSINCSNPKGFSQKAHCAGKKKNEDVAEARDSDTNFGSTVTHGSWVVYDGGKVKRFKSRDGAKAYAAKNGGKVASSEFYADKIQGKQDVAEEKVRLDPKCWKGKKIGNPKTKMKGGVRVNNCVPK